MYAMGGRFAQLLEWVGEKTENQTPDMFDCKRPTAPNRILAVARTKRRKVAYEKPNGLSTRDNSDDENEAPPTPTPSNGHTSDSDSSSGWDSDESL